MANERHNIRYTSAKLSGLAVAMFAFALWVMPPLYDLICEVAGLNGKTRGQYEAVAVEVDTSRLVKVQFVAINNENMPWNFAPASFALEVHPGATVNTHFSAYNPTASTMVGQAVPSMVPSNATDYFYKTECFCFNRQVLAAGESAELGLQFIVDQDIPKAVNTITLSYSLFDVTDMAAAQVMGESRQSQTESRPRAHATPAFILTAQSH